MRYPHFEMLPEDAFQHCGNGKIRLHNDVNPFRFVSDAVSSIGNAFESVIGGVGDALSGLDDWVRDEIPGGWLLPAAVVASVATGGGSLAALGEAGAETAAAAEAGGGAAIGESITSSITQTLVDSGIPFNTAVNLTSASTLATNAAINAATQALMTGKVDPEALIKSLATGVVSSVVGGVVSNATGGIDNKLLSSIVGSAVQGATGALIAGKNPVTSALASALAGGVGYSIQGSGIPQSAVTTLVRTLASGQSIQNALVSAAVSEGSAFLKPYIKEAFQQFSADKKDEAGEAFDKSVDSQVKVNKYIDDNRENIKQIQLDQSLLDDEANKEKLSNFQGLIDTYNEQKDAYEENKRIFNNYDAEMASRGYERLVDSDGDPLYGADGWVQRTGGHWVAADEERGAHYEPDSRYEDGDSIRYIPAPSRASFRDAANSAVGEANATGETLNRMYENEGVKDLITAHDRLVTNAEKFNAGYDPLFSDLNDYQAKLSNIVTTDKIADYFANEYSTNADQTRTTGQSATTDQTGTTQAGTAQAETTQGGATQAGTVTGDQVATNAVITPVADASSPSGYYASGTTTPVNADGSVWVPTFTDNTGTNVAANAIQDANTQQTASSDQTTRGLPAAVQLAATDTGTTTDVQNTDALQLATDYYNKILDNVEANFGSITKKDADAALQQAATQYDIDPSQLDNWMQQTGSFGGTYGMISQEPVNITPSIVTDAVNIDNSQSAAGDLPNLDQSAAALSDQTNVFSENVQTATSGDNAGSAAGSDAGTSGGVTSGVTGGVADGVTGGVSDGVAGSVTGGVTEGVTGGTGTTAVGDAGSAGDAGTSGTTGDAGTSGATGDAGVTGGSSSGNVNIDARIDELVQQGIDLRTALEQALKESKDAADKAAADKAAVDAKILLDKERERRALAAQTGYELVMPSAEALAYTPQTAPTFKSPFMSSPIMNAGEFSGPLTAFLKQVQKGDYTQDLYAQQKEEPVKQTQEPQMSSSYFNYGQDNNIDQILGQSSSVDPMYKTELLTAKKGGLATPLMAGGGTTRYGRYAGGGLNVVNHEGKNRIDFRTGDAVTGPGDGQSDDIPAMLADGEFVFPADVVAALGNGSTKAGSDKLYEMMHSIRSHARSAGPKDLPPPAKSPLDYLKKSRKARR